MICATRCRVIQTNFPKTVVPFAQVFFKPKPLRWPHVTDNSTMRFYHHRSTSGVKRPLYPSFLINATAIRLVHETYTALNPETTTSEVTPLLFLQIISCRRRVLFIRLLDTVANLRIQSSGEGSKPSLETRSPLSCSCGRPGGTISW